MRKEKKKFQWIAPPYSIILLDTLFLQLRLITPDVTHIALHYVCISNESNMVHRVLSPILLFFLIRIFLFCADYGRPMGEWSYWIWSHQHYRLQDRRFIKTLRKGFPGRMEETWPHHISRSGPGFYLGRSVGPLSMATKGMLTHFDHTAFRKLQNKIHGLNVHVCLGTPCSYF